MTHCGIAIDHPANAALLAHMAGPTIVHDRPGLVQKLERLQEQRFSPAIDDALHRLRNDIPDPPRPPSEAPGSVDTLTLGTHPDVVERLWAIGRALPTDCCWVAFRRPVLAHSQTGIIFGLGIGTLGYALRLPPPIDAEARTAGASQTRAWTGPEGPAAFSLADYGPDWWFGRWRADEDRRWSHAAYAHFGAM
jgi:hypothetical protein